MCITPHPKCQAILVMLATDVAAPTEVVAMPVVVVKAILSAPTPGAVVGITTAVVAAPAAAVSISVATATVSLLLL
jgi:hypothetical protein